MNRLVRAVISLSLLVLAWTPARVAADESRLRSCERPLLEAEDGGSKTAQWSETYPEHPMARTLDAMLSGKMSEAEGRATLLEQAGESFQRLGVQYEVIVLASGVKALKVVPIARGSGLPGHLLNRLAAGLQKYDPRFELIYDPSSVSASKTSTQGSISWRDGDPAHSLVLNMGHAGAMTGSARDPILVHEVIHAKHFGDANKGEDHPYQIILRPEDPAGLSLVKRRGRVPPTASAFSGHYDELMKADELVTYRYNIWEAARSFARAVRAGSQDAARLGKSLVGWAANLAIVSARANASTDLAIAGVDALVQAGKADWGKTAEFEQDEVRYQARIRLGTVEATQEKLVVVSVQEKPGFFTVGKKEVVGFQLHLALPDNATDSDPIPIESVRKQLSDLRDGAEMNMKVVHEIFERQQQIQDPYSLEPVRRETLLKELETLTSRKKALPGYPDKRRAPVRDSSG